jgi:hypothetical protein
MSAGDGTRGSARAVVAAMAFALAMTAVALAGCGGAVPSPMSGPANVAGPARHTHLAGEDCADPACHGTEHTMWALSLHAMSASDALLNVAHDKGELLTDECLHCMAPFQEKATIGALVAPINQTGPWKLLPAATKWQAIGCEVCHDPTSGAQFMLAFYNGTTGTYEPVADATALCEKCHQAGTDDSRDLKGSVHQGIQCVACHLLSGMRIDPRGSCSQCHPAIGPGKHPDVTGLDTTYKDPKSKNNIHFVTCKSCHPKRLPPLVEQSAG